MKFLSQKKDEVKKRFFMQDMVRKAIAQYPLLKKNVPIIEFHFDRLKELLREHRRALFGIGIFIVSLSILSAFSIGHASVVTFHPTTCLGGWEHPENAQGEPSVSADAKIEDFSISNSARLSNTSSSIYCGGFKGEPLDNTKPTNFKLSFSWSVDDGSVLHTEPQPFDTTTTTTSTETAPVELITTDVPETIDTPAPVDVIEVKDTPPTDDAIPTTDVTVPADTTTPVIDTPTPDAPPVENQVQAFLYTLFSTPVFAQDVADDVAIPISEPVVPVVTSTPDQIVATEQQDQAALAERELNSDKITTDAFAEVDYTVDGTNWVTLGTINRNAWHNVSFDIPLTAWSTLDTLQVAIKPIQTFDTPAVIYLDAMNMEVAYDNLEKILNRPTVVLKDASSLIVSEQTDFNSNENITFTITSPTVDIEGLKNLVQDGSAEVVDDKAGVLGDKIIDTRDTSLTDITKETKESVEGIIQSTKESLDNKVLPDIPSMPDVPPASESNPVSFLDFFQIKKALADVPDITAKVLDVSGNETDIQADVVTVHSNGQDTQQVHIEKGREFKPGKYTLEVTLTTPQAIVISQQDFTWGVLSINTNKSIYEIGDKAYLQMGVLNDGGHTICDADLDLVITTPNGNQHTFATTNTSIIREPQCGPDNVISVPDYYTHFTIPNETGTYKMRLTANTVNGIKTITDTFDVVQNANFVVERVGPSRIWPVADYPMTIKITAKNDWQGTVNEFVPDSFGISQSENGEHYDSVDTIDDPTNTGVPVKKISWNVSLVAGQEVALSYVFDAPNISPEYFVLGKIQLNNNGSISFEESRNWQIASDAACNATATGTWGGTDTANFTSCTGAASTGTGTGNRPGIADALTINSGVTVTLSASASVGSITMAVATAANGLSISTGATLTVTNSSGGTGVISYTGNTQANAQTITLNGTGSISAVSMTMNVPTSTGGSKFTCAAGSGSLTLSSTLTLTGNSTTTGTNVIAMDTCTLSVGGVISINGGSNATGVASITSSTGTITASAGLSFGNTFANTRFTTTGAATFNLTGTMQGAGIVSFNAGTTVNISGTSAISAAYTFPIVNITSGTTTLGNVGITFSGLVTVSGSLACSGATGTKAFSGGVMVNSGGSFNLSGVATITTFAGTLTASTGATAFNSGTGAVAFTASTTLAGSVAMSFGGTATVNSGVTLTNNNTSTVTLGALTFASAPASAITATLSTGSTTTVTGAITYAVGASAQSESILLNGTANLNAGSISMPVMTNTGSALLTCVSSCSGTLAVTGAVTVTGNSTAAKTGVSTIAMDTGTMTVGGLLSIAGGTVTAGTVSQSTGNLTLSAGITFSGTAANTRLTTTGANTITFTGNWTNTSAPTLTINAGTTLKTTGTVTLCVTNGMTWPGKLWVSSGTTSLALANTITGTTQVTSTLQNTSGATAKIFVGAVTLDSGSTFNMSVVTAATAEFRNGIINNGATTFTSGSTTTFSTNSQSISGTGTANMTLNATTTSANVTLTNNYTGNSISLSSLVITGGAITANSGLSLSDGTTTTLSGSLTVGANASTGAFSDTITLNGTATLTVGTTATFTIPTTTVSGAKEGIIAASGASGTVTINGTTTVNGGATGTQFCGIDLSLGTNALTTAAVTLTGGAAGTASLIMGTGALTINGAVTFGTAGNITRSVITTGASIITLNNSTFGANGTLSIASATLNTSGTTALNGAYTFPNLNVLSDTTTMGGVAITITGQTSISGTLNTSSATGTKTFGSAATNGLVTVNSGGTFNFSAFGTPLTFYGGITMASGATAFTMLTTNVVTFGSGLGNAQTISGDVDMTFGAVSIGNSEILTNASTATVTMQSLAIPSPGAIANGLSLSDLSTTTVTGAITMAGVGGSQSETITMNGSANLNAGSMSVAASTTAFDNGVICNGGTGTLTVTGALGVTAGTIAGGDSLLAMDTCTLVVNGLTTITGGTNGIASISASTGTLDFNAGITFATTLAQARITTSGAANIYFTGTMTGLGILSGINSATNIYTQGVTTINAAYTFPNLTVSTGTTTLGTGTITVSNGLSVSSGAILKFGAFAFTSSGTTTVDGAINCPAATCAGLKTFTGAVTVNSGGSFDLSQAVTTGPTTSFGSDITVASGGTFNTGIAGTTNTFTANSTLSGGGAMTFAGTAANATTINSGVLVTNSNTDTVTFGVLTLASGATGLSLSDLSTTTVTGLLSMAANATATNTNIAMNGTANLNAGTFTITAPTSTGTTNVTCNAGSGTFTVTGAITTAGNATSTGTTNMLMDSCNLSSGGVIGMGGGANAVGGINTLSFSTGTLTLLTGITFAGTSQPRNKLTTTDAGIINLTGTMTGSGTISIDPTTTFNTTGTAALNSTVTLPNLNVLAGTTSMGGVAVTVSGDTTIAGSVVGSSNAGTKTFTGPVTVNSGGSFDLSASGTYVVVNSFAGGITANGTTFNTSAGTTSFTASQSLAGSGPMVFGGAVTISNTFTVTNSNTNTVEFNAAITGGGSSANFATDINSTTNFGTTVMVTGTLTPSTSLNTIAYVGGTQTIKAPSTNPYYNLSITAAGVKSLAAITTVTGTINVSAGTLDTTAVSHYNINTGDIIIGNSGTLLGQAATITLTGNWSNAGTFTAGTSTVIMNGGTTVSVIGTTTFNNLTITHTSAKEVDFDSTGVTHVTGIFTATGHSGDLITLRSDATPTKWQIHPTGSASADYVEVMDGGCQNGSISILPTNFTNSGNNDSCWVPTSITFSYSNNDSVIGFGTLSSLNVCYATGDTLGSLSDTIAHSFDISTNSTAGYTLTYFGNTLTSGLNTISPATNIGTGGTSGTSQFAISGTMTSSGTGAMVSDYDHVIPQWSFVDGVTTAIASSSGPATSDTIDMHYEANISPTTPAGSYSTDITYILTGNF